MSFLNFRELYEEVYNNKEQFKKLIGTKDKKLGKKFIYLKSIILDIPVKILEGEMLLNETRDVCEEVNCEMESIEKPAEFQTVFMGNTETR
jgi:hypothetical protein